MNEPDIVSPGCEGEAQLPVGQVVSLPGHFDTSVVLEDARRLGTGFECRVRLPNGTLDEVVISADEAASLATKAGTPQALRLVDPNDLQLLVESARIRLAYAHDRQFAVSLSGIRTLPHQIEAVYQKMLPQPCLRFLLADDPGAGKTIMAGLLIKEMKLREAIDRVLILCPAPLTIQWQDEMQRWFGETFDIIFSAVDQQQLTNPWQPQFTGHRFARLRQAARCSRARVAAALGLGHYRRSPQMLRPHQNRRCRSRPAG